MEVKNTNFSGLAEKMRDLVEIRSGSHIYETRMEERSGNTRMWSMHLLTLKKNEE